MALLQEWREYAYSEEMQNSKEGQKLWENYFTLEKGIYEKLLANPSEIVEGTVQELVCFKNGSLTPLVLVAISLTVLYIVLKYGLLAKALSLAFLIFDEETNSIAFVTCFVL